MALAPYCGQTLAPVLELPVPEVTGSGDSVGPPALECVSLPKWACDLGVEGNLIVPACLIGPNTGPKWRRTDWFGAIDWYLHATAERSHERASGPIHSYSFRLSGWDARLWERAWANRIALFLRRWAAHAAEKDAESLFGPLPEPQIIVTHDVDAVTKTPAIRLKQTAFHLINATRALADGQAQAAARGLARGGRFALAPADYWQFEEITGLENRYGIVSHFNFYASLPGWQRRPTGLLMDPAYDIGHPRLRAELRRLRSEGRTIGLHPSFAAWADATAIRHERQRLEAALGEPVASCRQHWLRFGWQATWRAQAEAGLRLDTTLGFNDRPGFRNGGALAFRPWDDETGQVLDITAIPLVLMDSHVYDYRPVSQAERSAEIAHWIKEVVTVRGTATVVWHQRVFSPDYGWREGFVELLGLLAEERK